MTAGQRWQNLQKSEYCILGTAKGAHKPRTLRPRRLTEKSIRTTRSRKAAKPSGMLYLLAPWFQLRHLTCASAMVGSQVWGNELSMLTTDAVQKDGAEERAFGNAHWPNVAHGGSHEIPTLCFNCTSILWGYIWYAPMQAKNLAHTICSFLPLPLLLFQI